MNWYELKSLCIDHVAQDISRYDLPARFNDLPFDERVAVWAAAKKAAEPAAAEKIQSMSNMELLDLLSEVVAAQENL